MLEIKEIKEGDIIEGSEVLEYETITRPLYTRTRIVIDYGPPLPPFNYSEHQDEQAWLISSGGFNWVILDDGSRFSVHPNNYRYASVYKPESYIDNNLTDLEKVHGKGWGKIK